MKVPPHPPPPSLIWSLTIWADCVEGNASLASIGTLLVALVFFKVISVAPPRKTYGYVPGQPEHAGLFGCVDKTVGSVSDGNPQWLSIVLGRLLPSCFHMI